MSAEDFVRRLFGPSKLNQPPGPPERLRACAWARVSTGEQEERGLSIPEQFREIKCFAEKRGIDILREFYEAASAFRHQERAHSDDVDQSFRSDADQFGAKRRRALPV